MTSVVCSVGTIGYGWDCPQVSCAILARPTQSLALHLQQCGRILRPFPAPQGPRAYQDLALSDLRAALRTYRRPVLVMPTGAGKSYLAAKITLGAMAKGKRIGFLVNRRILVHDLSRRLEALGVPHGVMMSDDPRYDLAKPAQVCSIDTLNKRKAKPEVDFWFLDESHLAISDMWSRVIAEYPDKPLVGLTATPCRLDNKGLGQMFDAIVQGPSVAELTEQRYLVPARVFAPHVPAMPTKSGEFTESQMVTAMDQGKIIGDIVRTWQLRANGRRTVVFAVNVEHSKRICNEFMAAGISAEHVDADTPDAERDRIWARLADDALRKHDALILDHAGNTLRHGFPDDPREWTLEDGDVRRASQDDPALSVRRCPQCWLTFKGGSPRCPGCGCAVVRSAREIEQAAGELEELQRARKQAQIEARLSAHGMDEKRRKYFELKDTAAARGYKPGWPVMQYRLRYREWPPSKVWNSEWESRSCS